MCGCGLCMGVGVGMHVCMFVCAYVHVPACMCTCHASILPYSGLFSKNKFSAKSAIIGGEKISHAFIFGQPGLGPKYTEKRHYQPRAL